ncbi:MAG: efflux transporter periplasmic adaptor subunit, partial [Desulfobulbaceae bacterium]|nr:efflux transporter periplasmic adaptor subunit [Desulfobulbaceae bacterium]
MKLSKTTVVALILGIIILIALVITFLPSPLPVDSAAVVRGDLQVTLDGEGITRVRNRFTIASPFTGKLSRIQLEEGDSVSNGSVVACIEPPPLDARQHEEANARVRSASATLQASEAEVKQVQFNLDQADLKYKRFKKLYQDGAITKEAFELAENEMKILAKESQQAKLRADAARYDVAAVKSTIDQAVAGRPVKVTSPASGRLLRIFEKSERVVMAGAPLMEVGDPSDVEIVIDVLSS